MGGFIACFLLAFYFFLGSIIFDSRETRQDCRQLAYEMNVSYRLSSDMVFWTSCELRVGDEWVDSLKADKLDWENR